MQSAGQADRVTAEELRTLHGVVFSLDGLAHPACHLLWVPLFKRSLSSCRQGPLYSTPRPYSKKHRSLKQQVCTMPFNRSFNRNTSGWCFSTMQSPNLRQPPPPRWSRSCCATWAECVGGGQAVNGGQWSFLSKWLRCHLFTAYILHSRECLS